jgi:hypothetical protein
LNQQITSNNYDMLHFLRFAFLPLAFLISTSLAAQGWQRVYGPAGDQRAFAVRVTADGGLVAAGSSSDSLSGRTDWYFLRTDSVGNVLASRTWGDSLRNENFQAILPAGADRWWAAGTDAVVQQVLWNLDLQGVVQLLDSQGTALGGWTGANVGSPTELLAGTRWGDTSFLYVGSRYFPLAVDGWAPNPFFLKIDNAGVLQWHRYEGIGSYGTASSALELPDGRAIVAGQSGIFGNDIDVFCLKINTSGEVEDALELDLPNGQNLATTLLLPGGNELMMVGNELIPSGNNDVLLVRLNLDLDTLSTHRVPLPGRQIPYDALVLPDGDLLIAGEHTPEGSNSRDAFLMRTNALGQLLWFRTYGGLGGDIFWDVELDHDSTGLVIAGQTASFGVGGDLQAWLLRSDLDGNVWRNRAIGQVARDQLQNCLIDSTETSLAGWLVTAAGDNPPLSLYTLTDSAGRYEMAVDTGVWHLTVLAPSAYWVACEDSVALNFPSLTDTVALDFPIQTQFDCPLLDVDVTVPFLRRCFENTYYVKYHNYGTAAADSAVVEVILDPYLTLVAADLAYTSSGDTLWFLVGEVPELTGGQFTFRVLLDCDSTVPGQTHCVAAHIRPDSLCTEFDPEWDGSNLDVTGYCAGDSVMLTLTNTGSPMLGTVNFIITEDQIIFKMDVLQLAAGQDTTFALRPNGRTVRIETEQRTGHPLGNRPTLVIEGCGASPFSTGWVLQLPTDDGDPFSDVECRQSIGSYDPNDKQGLPTGVGAAHVVAEGTPIEYLIRFQNTGTDTAFRVEIRDLLSTDLDPATLRLGASSHPYQLTINGLGQLRFVFDPIALPDSAANQAGSQGFVKFSIEPQKHLALGTRIDNQAAIYFDFNPPVLTNTTWHTLGDPYGDFTSGSHAPAAPRRVSSDLVAWPNPTSGLVQATFLTPPKLPHGCSIELWDAPGKCRLVTTWPADGAPTLDLRALPNGVYFLVLKNENGHVVARTSVVKCE